MNYKEALAIIQANIKDAEVENAYEVDNYFVFGLKTKGAPIGVSTGPIKILVDKKTKKIDSSLPGDTRLRGSKILKIYNQGDQ